MKALGFALRPPVTHRKLPGKPGDAGDRSASFQIKTEEEGFVVPLRVDSPELIDFLIGNFCRIGSKRQLWQL